MSEKPKPLTRADLTIIEANIEANNVATYDEAKDLLSAEAFWREAVKKIDPTEYDKDGVPRGCLFCIASSEQEHKPDCPWLLAQEGGE